MKVQQIIALWKGNKQFTAIAKRAAALKKAGHRGEQITATLISEFGAPPQHVTLRDTPQPLQVYGEIGRDIEYSAVEQIRLALRLPIAVAGALMPDAHHGYTLPVGGVFAAHRAVAPSMVGVDIGCRMHLSIFDLPPAELMDQREKLFADLQAVTVFGSGVSRDRPAEHPILDDPRWQSTALLRSLRDIAHTQLGTSGSGNHFAELIVGECIADECAIPPVFSGLLTHSGSRGVGHAIATRYMVIAAQETAHIANVPRMYEWLSLEQEAGLEYWQAMELAGAFAQANHEVIHDLFARRTRLRSIHVIQNHHNFAWRQGDIVLHRKGATPAEPGTSGVIPGSMGSASYIVQGLGVTESLSSASHGAGRVGSRRQAKDSITMREVRQWLKQQDVLVEGLSVDESPQAYKDIERVMSLQIAAGLVKPLARMRPVAVIMAGERGDA